MKKITFKQLKRLVKEGAEPDEPEVLNWHVFNKETGEEMASGTVEAKSTDIEAECKKWEDMLVYLYGDDVEAKVTRTLKRYLESKAKLFTEGDREADILDYINVMAGKIDYNQMVEDLVKEFGISEDEAESYIQKSNHDDSHRFDEGGVEVCTEEQADVVLDIPHDRNADAWSEGFAYIGDQEYSVQVKWFDEPSMFGIRKGRISKLWVGKANSPSYSDKPSYDEVFSFDRGWVERPKTDEDKAILKAVLKEFN